MANLADDFIDQYFNPALKKLAADIQDAIDNHKSFPDDYISGNCIGDELKEVNLVKNDSGKEFDISVTVTPCRIEMTSDNQDFYKPLSDQECKQIARASNNPFNADELTDDVKNALEAILHQRNNVYYNTEYDGDDYADELYDSERSLNYDISCYIAREMGIEYDVPYEAQDKVIEKLKANNQYNSKIADLVYRSGYSCLDFDVSYLLDEKAKQKISKYSEEYLSIPPDDRKNIEVFYLRHRNSYLLYSSTVQRLLPNLAISRDDFNTLNSNFISEHYGDGQRKISEIINADKPFSTVKVDADTIKAFKFACTFKTMEDLILNSVDKLPVLNFEDFFFSKNQILNLYNKSINCATPYECVELGDKFYKEVLSQIPCRTEEIEINEQLSNEGVEDMNSNTLWSVLLDGEASKLENSIDVIADNKFKVIQSVKITDEDRKMDVELQRELRYELAKTNESNEFPEYQLERIDIPESSKRAKFHLKVGSLVNDQENKDVIDVIEDIAYQGAQTDDERKVEDLINEMVISEQNIQSQILERYGITKEPDFNIRFETLYHYSSDSKLADAQAFIENNNPFPNANELFKCDELTQKKPLLDLCKEQLQSYGDNLSDSELSKMMPDLKFNYVLAIMATDGKLNDLGIESNDPKLSLDHDSYKEMMQDIAARGETFCAKDAHEIASKYVDSLNYDGKKLKSTQESNNHSFSM